MADVFDQMLTRYEITTKDDERNAIHEIMQQVALAGLYRGKFFDKAAFYGGTCLRIFHGLNRFSEDMDFSLLEADSSFSIENYFEFIDQEFKAIGREVEISKKNITKESRIESAFLKDNTGVYNIRFRTQPSIKIKLEVDTLPPLRFETEQKLLLLPFSFMTRCFALPDLFAGKIHAFLFRNWRNRVKGRDWYDFEWYMRNNITVNLEHFKERATQSEGESFRGIGKEDLKLLLKEKISNTSISQVKADLLPFIKNPREIEIWSADYFQQLVERL